MATVFEDIGILLSVPCLEVEVIGASRSADTTAADTRAAAAEYRAALHILTPRSPNWMPPVMTYSALTGDGIADLWAQVIAHRDKLTATGELAARRREQQVKWMWTMLDEFWRTRIASEPKLRAKLPRIEAAVAAGELTPASAVDELVAALGMT